MARLKNPKTGTVISAGGKLAERYQADGWVDPDAAPVVEDEPEAQPEGEQEESAEDAPAAEEQEESAEDAPAAEEQEESAPRRGRPAKTKE